MAQVIYSEMNPTGKQRRRLHQQVRLLHAAGLLKTSIADADAFIAQEINLSDTPRLWASKRIDAWNAMLEASKPKQRKPRRKFADPTK